MDPSSEVTPYAKAYPCPLGCGATTRWAIWRDEQGRRCRRLTDWCDCAQEEPAEVRPLTAAEMEVGRQVARRINASEVGQ